MTRIVELVLAGGAGMVVGFLLATLFRTNRIGQVHTALTELTGELTWFAKSLRDLVDPPEINATSPHGEDSPSAGSHAIPPDPVTVTVVRGDTDTSPAGFPTVKLPATVEPSRRLPARTVRADVLTKRLKAEQAARSSKS